MPSFPTSLPSFPSAATLASNNLSTNPHSTLHGNLGGELLAALTKIGIDSSGVTTSLDYLVNQLYDQAGFPCWIVAASGADVTASDLISVCDGVNDEVTIQAAINAAAFVGGGVVLLGAGSFQIDAVDVISIPSHVSLIGLGGGANGTGATKLVCNATTPGPVVKMVGTNSTTRLESPQLHNLTIDGDDGAGYGITGLYAKYVVGIRVSGVGFYSLQGYGMHLVGVSDGIVTGKTRFDYCGSQGHKDASTTITEDLDISETGVDVTSRSNFTQSGNFFVKVDNEYMKVTAGHGSGAGTFTVTRGALGSSAATHSNGATITCDARPALMIEDDDGAWASDNLIISECWWEQCWDKAIHIVKDGPLAGTGSHNPYHIVIRDCKIEANGGVRGGSGSTYIELDAVTGIMFTHNYFYCDDLQTDAATNTLGAYFKLNDATFVDISANEWSYDSAQTNPAFTYWIDTGGTNSALVIDRNMFTHGNTRVPTACLRWNGTNEAAHPRNNFAIGTTATLESSAPNTHQTRGDLLVVAETGTSFTVAADVTLASNIGSVTANLPTVVGRLGKQYIVKKTGASGTVTIDGNASETIDGASTYALSTQYESVTLVSDGLTGWNIV